MLLRQSEERVLAERLAEVGEAAGTFLQREAVRGGDVGIGAAAAPG